MGHKINKTGLQPVSRPMKQILVFYPKGLIFEHKKIQRIKGKTQATEHFIERFMAVL